MPLKPGTIVVVDDAECANCGALERSGCGRGITLENSSRRTCGETTTWTPGFQGETPAKTEEDLE